jgi:hypothetical protein
MSANVADDAQLADGERVHEAAAKARSRAASAHGAEREKSAEFHTIDDAAKMLATTPVALRARCRRHARREGREVVARLGAGVVAYKFGSSWRVRFTAC